MAIAFLIAIAVIVCFAVQLLVRRYWFGLFLSVVATLTAWVLAPLMFALTTTRLLVTPGQWSSAEAFLGAALIAQCVARILAFKRRLTGDD